MILRKTKGLPFFIEERNHMARFMPRRYKKNVILPTSNNLKIKLTYNIPKNNTKKAPLLPAYDFLFLFVKGMADA